VALKRREKIENRLKKVRSTKEKQESGFKRKDIKKSY
jgi:hypothetical protein